MQQNQQIKTVHCTSAVLKINLAAKSMGNRGEQKASIWPQIEKTRNDLKAITTSMTRAQELESHQRIQDPPPYGPKIHTYKGEKGTAEIQGDRHQPTNQIKKLTGKAAAEQRSGDFFGSGEFRQDDLASGFTKERIGPFA